MNYKNFCFTFCLLTTIANPLFSQNKYWGFNGGLDNFNFNEVQEQVNINGRSVETQLEPYTRTPSIGGDYFYAPGRLNLEFSLNFDYTSLLDLGRKEFSYQFDAQDTGTVLANDQALLLKGGIGYNLSKKHIITPLFRVEGVYGNMIYFDELAHALEQNSLQTIINDLNASEIANSIIWGLTFKMNLGYKLNLLNQKSMIFLLTPGYSTVLKQSEDRNITGFDFLFSVFSSF